jgi:hypothetical protein
MSDGTRPAWAQRLTAERVARGWTHQQTVDALRMQSDRLLPDSAHLLRMWKNWEHGKHRPRPGYQRLIATTFGTVSAAIFGPELVSPPVRDERDALVPLAGNTAELVERIRHSDLDRPRSTPSRSLSNASAANTRTCPRPTDAEKARPGWPSWFGSLIRASPWPNTVSSWSSQAG